MSMTNEELAELIKAGHGEYCAQLWEQTKKLYYMKVLRFYNRNDERCTRYGVEFEDLQQASYFAMLAAVEAYNSEKGFKFVSYIDYHLKNELNTLTGITRHKKNPLNNCNSLDKPVNDESEDTYLDFIEDEESQKAYELIDKQITLDKLRYIVDEALQSLPPNYADVLILRYFKRLSLKEIAELKNVSLNVIREREKQAIRKLKVSHYIKELNAFRDELISTRAYKNTGLRSFENLGGSSVEITLEYVEQMTAKATPPGQNNKTFL